MQNNSLAQIKLRANEFIEDYERQVTEREYQKQKLKQNIMLEIMSNRHRSQASQSNLNDVEKTESIFGDAKSIKQPLSDDRALSLIKNNKSNVPGVTRSNSVPNALCENEDGENEPKLQSAQITFKMSKNRNNFTNEDKPQEKKQYLKEQLPEQQSRYFDENETLRQPKNKSNKSIDLYESQKNKSSLRPKRQSEQLQGNYRNKPQIKNNSSDSETERRQNIQEQIQLIPEKNDPIFLTLDEDQSVQISQDKKNKNLAFDIVMEKSEPIDDIEELRKKKIEEMEKKRQQRMEEFRKQEQLKKLNNQEKDVKRSNSYLKNKSRQVNKVPEQDVVEVDFAKSRSRRKINVDREEKVNISSQNVIQQSHYNMKPPQQPQRSSYIAPERQRTENDYVPTPKSIISDYRVDKSKGKNTIFRESPKRIDKSASKYSQDPKIQPKQRKNTFVKQSNKKLMITALSNACLPGELNRKQREKLTDIIERDPSEFLVFLFKQYSRKVIKAIYTLDSSQTMLIKIYGDKSPQQIIAENVQSFYRFDSGSRQFKKLDGCKSFSLVVHAIDLA